MNIKIPYLEVGQTYEIHDYYGMTTSKAKFLGTGGAYESFNSKNYFKKYDLYIFERENKKGEYKYCLAQFEIHNNKVILKAYSYGNDIHFLLYNFRQTFVKLDDELDATDFSKIDTSYSKEKANSRTGGFYIE